jgi:DNA-binding HxlR family transcriptional regulator
MGARTYGQYCGLAYALELVGERWALLIVRDLLTGPKRFTDLRRGLPRIPSNVLSARLRELEEAGVVRRRLLPLPGTAVVYDLTDEGRELEDAVLRLGLWGARFLGRPRAGEIVTPESLVIALRAAFRPERARSLSASYELRLGEIVLQARVRRGALDARTGPADEPDLVIDTDLAIKELLSGELTPEEALRSDRLRLTGDRALLPAFVDAFRIPAPATNAA